MPTYLINVAGLIATMLFVLSTAPMLIKAFRTRDLSSYSGSNLLMANAGNLVQTVYLSVVPSLPIWTLHAFNSLASATMLTLWVLYRQPERASSRLDDARQTPGAPAPSDSSTRPTRSMGPEA